MRPTEHALRREVCATARLTWERGWVANHDGNATAWFAPGRILATPTALSKRSIEPEDVLVVNERGRVVRGRRRPFSEMGLHLAVYAQRPDVGAVLHAHPPHATALAASARPLACFLPESVVSLGDRVPLVPAAPPGPAAEAALAPFIEPFDAVLLESHGALSWGDDLDQAFLRMELVEHLARIACLAEVTGGVRPLPDEVVQDLLERRAAAGLGPLGRGR